MPHIEANKPRVRRLYMAAYDREKELPDKEADQSRGYKRERRCTDAELGWPESGQYICCQIMPD